jgi:hypothetical protein
MPQIYNPHDNRSEVMEQTKRYAEEIIIKQPHLAGKAISERNFLIKTLKAEIEHRRIAFQEIEDRFQESSDFKILNEKLSEDYKKLHDEHKKMSLELAEYKASLDGLWNRKVEQFSEKLPPRISSIIKFCFTPPVSTYLWLILFALFFIASITGWAFVIDAIKPILFLFGIGKHD